MPTPNLTLTTTAAVTDNVMLNGNRVMITTAVAGNAGTYTCNASNFLNFDEQTFELQVGGKSQLQTHTQLLNKHYLHVLPRAHKNGRLE